MIIRTLYFVLILICSQLSLIAKPFQSDTIFNQTDANGMKQGYWKVSYENGKTKYEAFFRNNKPIGEMKRYYDDGTIKAIMTFDQTGKKSYAKLFYNNGQLAGEGNFIESMKDSIWKYYSFYDKTLKMEENYTKGVKNGISKKYYNNGKVAEELNFSNNLKTGCWKQYFDNGNLKLETNYINDKREGVYNTYYLGGKIETKGQFINNLMDGDWVYFDEDGKIKMTVKYSKGIPLNKDVLEKKDEELFKMLDSNKGKIPEPDENNMLIPH